jgi:hypothetical protein
MTFGPFQHHVLFYNRCLVYTKTARDDCGNMVAAYAAYDDNVRGDGSCVEWAAKTIGAFAGLTQGVFSMSYIVRASQKMCEQAVKVECRWAAQPLKRRAAVVKPAVIRARTKMKKQNRTNKTAGRVTRSALAKNPA